MKISEWNINQTDAAKLLGVSRRYLTIDDSDPAPRNEDGSYNAVKLVAWYSEKWGELNDQLKYERIRKIKRENAVAEGTLLDMETLRPNFILLQDSLLELGDKLARKRNLTGKQAQAMLNKTLKTVEAQLRAMVGDNQPESAGNPAAGGLVAQADSLPH